MNPKEKHPPVIIQTLRLMNAICSELERMLITDDNELESVMRKSETGKLPPELCW